MYYYQKTKLRITFEYILFSGLNDTEEDVKALVKLTKLIPSKINLIPYHKIELNYLQNSVLKLKPASASLMEKFANLLRENQVTVFVRSSAGEDIRAACGQLVVKSKLNPI